MDFSLLQENKIFMSSISAVGGIFISLITQQILKKRGVLSYQVNHNRIGFSTDDVVFGSVRVTWNGTEASNLYFSTIEIKNESTLDFENIVIRAYSTDTNLLTEQTQLIGTSHILEWSEKFKEKLHIADGNVATQPQKDLHSSQREYNIPALNRGQTIRLNYLNSPKNTNSPNIWLDVIHKGVKLIYRPQIRQIYGVSQTQAALVGMVVGFVVFGLLVATIDTIWIAAAIALIYGYVAVVPGAYLIKFSRKIRDFIGG